MSSTLSPGISRFAAIGLLIALVAGLTGYVLLPAAQHTLRLGEEIAAKRELLGRLVKLEPEANAAGSNAQQAERALLAELTVPGETEPIRLAAVQATIRRLAATSGARLESTRTLPPVQRGQVQLAGLNIAMRAPVDALQRLLHAIEVHRPILIVDGLDIVPIPAEGSGAKAVAEDTRQLRVELRILAYVGAAQNGARP
jgi:hypothetical protein